MILFEGVVLSAFGRHSDRSLGRVVIVNDGSGDSRVGNYNVTLKRERGRLRQARVVGFPRKRKDAWDLLREALIALDVKVDAP